MKPFDQLTRLGQIRRRRALVFEALKAYDLEIASVDFLADHTNTLFKITAVDGTKYAMRIYSDMDTGIKENRAEMFWLNALVKESDLNVTKPIARNDGELLSIINLPGLPMDQRCALFSWIPGRTLGDTKGAINSANYVKYGAALAKLHNHSETLNPLPEDINPKRWDRVFYYENEPIVYNDPNYGHLFSSEQIALLDKIIERADRLLASIFARPNRILIHGDLHTHNLHIYKDELYLIDFEDLNLGYDLQDVAITFYYGRDHAQRTELLAAFKEGYSAHRPWPLESEEQLQTLIAARMTMFVNYVAHALDEADAKEYIDGWFTELTNYWTKFV